MMSLVGERASNEEWIDGTNARWISGKLFTYGYRVVKRFIFFQAVPPSPGCLATPLMLQRGLDGPLKKTQKNLTTTCPCHSSLAIPVVAIPNRPDIPTRLRP